MHGSSGVGIQTLSAFIFCGQSIARQHAHKSMFSVWFDWEVIIVTIIIIIIATNYNNFIKRINYVLTVSKSENPLASFKFSLCLFWSLTMFHESMFLRAMTHVSTRWPLHPAGTPPWDGRASSTHTELIAASSEVKRW